ncbi:SET and MYND domain-containing protein 4 [Anthophora plagiata]
MLEEKDSVISDFFRRNFAELQKAISPQDMKRFVNLSTNSERIRFVLSYPEVYTLSVEVDNEMLKNSEKACQLKNTGNNYFCSNEFIKALETYSNAVLLAPPQELSVILANRSATLYHLEHYSYALTDAEEALRIGYPRELLYKIEERRARCFLGLKRSDDAVFAFRSALKALDSAKLPFEKKQRHEMNIRTMLALIDKCNNLVQKTKKDLKRNEETNELKILGPKMENYNPLYPSCSKAIEIRDDGGDIGRHAVASRNIKPGEILAIEKPYCSSLLAEYRLTHCHCCTRKIFVPIPADCQTCSYVAYCSTSCRDEDAKMHENECTLLPILWTSKISVTCFLAIKAVTQHAFEKIFERRDKLEASKGKLEVSKQKPHLSGNIEAFYGLITHEEKRTAEDLLHRTYISCWLLRLLKKGSYLPEEVKTLDNAEAKPSDGELFIGGLILHSLMVMQFNAHEISELVMPRSDKTLAKAKNNFIGGGLYPTISLFNHSCNPGIIRYFVGTTMVVRAIRSISVGEDVSENYGQIFTTTPEAERKRKLRWQYWFDCNCEACTQHWPILEKLDTTILRFKCGTGQKCGNILPVRTDTEEFMIKCPKCDKNTNLFKALKALQDTDVIFKTASRYMNERKYQEALKHFLEILKLLDENLTLPIKDYHIFQESIRLIMLSFGNVAYV